MEEKALKKDIRKRAFGMELRGGGRLGGLFDSASCL
jgi:hypothetical protein